MRHVVKKIKEVIVVEGKKDTAAVQRAVAADTLETGGSAVGSDLISAIRRARDKRGVIILTDPDGPGERIRRIISEQVSGCRSEERRVGKECRSQRAAYHYKKNIEDKKQDTRRETRRWICRPE